jgi:hypothetical protein
MSISAISFLISSKSITKMLIELDAKYESAYKKQIKSKNYEGIA